MVLCGARIPPSTAAVVGGGRGIIGIGLSVSDTIFMKGL